MLQPILMVIICLLHTNIVYTKSGPASSPSANIDGESLTLRLLQNPLHDPEVYSQALAILESLQSTPSCNRAATVSLIDSCQSLEASEGSDVLLSEVRENYAARLAMCELMGAKVQLPSQCEMFVMSERHCKKKKSGGLMSKFRKPDNSKLESTVCFAETSRAQLKRCLGVIHDKPQWWTSYSNALQNVLVVCQASRGAIEQEEIFKVYRASTSMTNDLTAKLAEILKKSVDYTTQVELIREKTVQDWHKHVSEAKTYTALIMEETAKTLQGFIISANEGASAVTSALERLIYDIKGTHAHVLDTKSALVALRADSLEQTQKLHDSHAASLIAASLKAHKLQESLKVTHERVPELDKFLDKCWYTINNLSTVVTESSAVIEEYIMRNTKHLEKQADAISRVAANSFDISNWLVYLVLPLTIQFLMPGYHKTAAILSGLVFIFLAVLRKVLNSPIQALQTLWNFKSICCSGFRPYLNPALFIPILMAIMILIIGAWILVPKIDAYLIGRDSLHRQRTKVDSRRSLEERWNGKPV